MPDLAIQGPIGRMAIGRKNAACFLEKKRIHVSSGAGLSVHNVHKHVCFLHDVLPHNFFGSRQNRIVFCARALVSYAADKWWRNGIQSDRLNLCFGCGQHHLFLFLLPCLQTFGSLRVQRSHCLQVQLLLAHLGFVHCFKGILDSRKPFLSLSTILPVLQNSPDRRPYRIIGPNPTTKGFQVCVEQRVDHLHQVTMNGRRQENTKINVLQQHC
mmetsp:Transcript_15618/g.43093  ORF Transcript_15618/g.43093 Transcript_15618/m.43093 type:complete len:213 (+) Transcript_15618:1674-2312(+)